MMKLEDLLKNIQLDKTTPIIPERRVIEKTTETVKIPRRKYKANKAASRLPPDTNREIIVVKPLMNPATVLRRRDGELRTVRRSVLDHVPVERMRKFDKKAVFKIASMGHGEVSAWMSRRKRVDKYVEGSGNDYYEIFKNGVFVVCALSEKDVEKKAERLFLKREWKRNDVVTVEEKDEKSLLVKTWTLERPWGRGKKKGGE